MPAGKTYTTIATTTLSSNTDITFSNISGSYTDLVLVLQGTRTASSNLYVQVGNGSPDTGPLYSLTWIRGTGSAANSGRNQGLSNGWFLDLGPDHTIPQTYIVRFMNYSNTTTFKNVLWRSDQTASETVVGVGLWSKTNAIDTIKIWGATGGATLSSGYTASLYGITAA